ncbi:MAG: DUF2721 domain-containing protein [Alteromonadaceae bacterium]|nr:DUF2721 domain-containing protein [Alteromonadaceae bacterium]
MDIDINVVELIQISLVPVFLIVGIGQILNAATARLARVVDRIRWYEDLEAAGKTDFSEKQNKELTMLERRMKLSNWSINFLSAAVLFICIDVVFLLVNAMYALQIDKLILFLFISNLLCITLGVVAFFLEVTITASVEIHTPKKQSQKKV